MRGGAGARAVAVAERKSHTGISVQCQPNWLYKSIHHNNIYFKMKVFS